jgi:hypothetical protein
MNYFIVFLPILGLVFMRAAVVEGSAVENASSFNLAAPWFGATPTKLPLELHRRGWEACLRCGGAERLGAIVNVGNLTELNQTGAAAVLDACGPSSWYCRDQGTESDSCTASRLYWKVR